MKNTLKLQVMSTFDCLLLADKKIYLKADYTLIELEMKNQDSFFVYPIGSGISYAVTVKNGNIVQNQHIQITQYFDDEFKIVLKPFNALLPPYKIESKNFDGCVLSIVFSNPMLFQIEKNNQKFYCKIDQDFEYYEFLSLSGVPCLKLKNEDFEKLIYFQDDKFNSLKGKITLNNDNLEVVTPLMDISHRAKVFKFKLQNKRIEKQDETLIYLDNFPVYPTEEGLIPFAFFEAVKCGDIQYAKNLLDDDLKQQASQQMFEDYFGKFEQITPYNYKKDRGYYIGLSHENVNKVYKISMKNNKICEINRLLRTNGVDNYE